MYFFIVLFRPEKCVFSRGRGASERRSPAAGRRRAEPHSGNTAWERGRLGGQKTVRRGENFGTSSGPAHPCRPAQGELPRSAVRPRAAGEGSPPPGKGSPPPCPTESPAAPRGLRRARALEEPPPRNRRRLLLLFPFPKAAGDSNGTGAPGRHPPPRPGGCSPQCPPPGAADGKSREQPARRGRGLAEAWLRDEGSAAARPPPPQRPRRSATAPGGGRPQSRAGGSGQQRRDGPGRAGARRREIPHFAIVSGGRVTHPRVRHK